MSYTKKIVCLANSRKYHGRCFAGKEIINGHCTQWIRPVSDRDKGEISEKEQKFENENNPQILDIVSIEFIKSKPNKYQTENHLINPQCYWKKTGTAKWGDLEQFKDHPDQLWINGYSSSKGRNDRMPEAEAFQLQESLYLIWLETLKITIIKTYDESLQARAVFYFNNQEYNLSITDQKIKSDFLKRGISEYLLNNLYLCVSIGEPFEKFCYKLIASIIKTSSF